MTSNLLFAVGTLGSWCGWAALLKALLSRSERLVWAGVGGFLLLVSSISTPIYDRGFGIPLVWMVMPFTGWGAVICFAFTLFEGLRGALNDSRQSYRNAIGWLIVAAGFGLMVGVDPDRKFDVLRGSIILNTPMSIGLLVLAVTAILGMVALGKRGGTFARTVALSVGCVIFGLPFFWLLVTSFKEERDLAGTNGLVWIPKVQRTVPFFDPERPRLVGTYRGSRIEAMLAGRMSDGSYFVEVQRPSSLRGVSFSAPSRAFQVVASDAPVFSGNGFTGFVERELNDGRRLVQFLSPAKRKGTKDVFRPSELEPVRDIGLRTLNYTEALEAMPPETQFGLLYLKNTLVIVVLSVVGTILSSSLVAFGFARLRFPGRDAMFKVLLASMMLPGAVTLLPQFLLFRSLGWIDTLYPLWVPAFFGSAFNIFLLRQFFNQIPAELEDAGKIDGAGVLRSFWSIMLPQVKPALAVVAIWTFMGAWNNFMGPLIYINSPENMPLSYALQLFQSERGGSPGLMMAFATLTILPVLGLFFFAQRYFVEGVTLSGLGGR